MFRRLLRKYGAVRLTVVIALIAILISVTITVSIDYLVDQDISQFGVILSILIPAVIAPVFEYQALRLLDQLDKTEERLRTLSITDELTGVYNRRHFMELANAEFVRMERYGGVFSIAIMDFDNFKMVNDLYGHLAGDKALVLVSEICRANLRENDIFARYGGDEFVFLFPQTDESQAREGLQRTILQISNAMIDPGRQIHIHVSMGIFTFSPKVHTLDDLLQNADMALYRAKQTGGNKVV